MVENFIKEYAKRLANRPEAVRVEARECDGEVEIILITSKEDMGKMIGKNGKMIFALKNLLAGCRAKSGMNYKLIVQSND